MKKTVLKKYAKLIATVGVNVQNKLIAIHHLDVPWRPADMVQREGRILRQGNENKKVKIFRYITEGSFDAYSWQLLETKQEIFDAFADESVAAGESMELDEKSFGNIMQDEIDRISAKRGQVTPEASQDNGG